jgi:hypothetical protein
MGRRILSETCLYQCAVTDVVQRRNPWRLNGFSRFASHALRVGKTEARGVIHEHVGCLDYWGLDRHRSSHRLMDQTDIQELRE